ncbi:hypothetical protein SI65_06026 [Aspergillus cristatus]|uniref:Uncharacterized protein n=1 Tax=Aspergillus cristatus TaxID=573508 RepID=A0A1E3BB14_ASPCR|nr:hypothetical protein SI65_06026 [Aspergillus cristatus]
MEISRNPESVGSVELESTIEALENELEHFAIATVPESHLNEDQQIAKNDIPAVKRQIKMVQEYHKNPQWKLFMDEETGNIKIFEEGNEVVFDEVGCYRVLPKDQASENG